MNLIKRLSLLCAMLLIINMSAPAVFAGITPHEGTEEAPQETTSSSSSEEESSESSDENSSSSSDESSEDTSSEDTSSSEEQSEESSDSLAGTTDNNDSNDGNDNTDSSEDGFQSFIDTPADETGTNPEVEYPDNYVQIGTLNETENSISNLIFTIGLTCIAIGSVGLIALLIWSISTKSNPEEESISDIYTKIDIAKARQSQTTSINKPAQTPPSRPQNTAPKPPVQRQQSPKTRTANTAGTSQNRPTTNTNRAQQKPQQRPQQRKTAKPVAPKATPKKASKYDTEEILNEALRND